MTKFVRSWHLPIGLVLALPQFILGLTGSILLLRAPRPRGAFGRPHHPPPHDFFFVLHQIHETFAMGMFGRALVVLSGLGLVVLCLTGIPIALRRLRTRPWKLQHTHGAIGLVCVIFLASIAATGTVIAAGPFLGMRAPMWMRVVHQGAQAPQLWRGAEFVLGFAPVFFAVSGVMMKVKRSA